jgi:hypothetical protein
MEHDYRIERHINGRRMLGLGSGYTDPASGVSEIDVTFEELADKWDPRSIVLMCCARATIMASQEKGGAVGMYQASGGHVTIGRDLVGAGRWAVVRNQQDEIMVDVRASSETDLCSPERFDRSRVDGGISHLVPGTNGIANVDLVTGVMMQAGPKVVTVTTRYQIALEDGSTVYGTTFYPHYLPKQRVEIPGIQMLTVDSITQEFDGTHLWVKSHSSVEPLERSATMTVQEPVAVSARR